MKLKRAASVLGVNTEDGEQSIRAAYRRLAIKWHPDKNKDVSREEATQRFQEINQAFQALSHYKETGHEESDNELTSPDQREEGFMDLAEMMMFFEFMMGGGASANGSGRSHQGFVDVDMMFDFAFGGGRQRGGTPAHWGAMDDDDDEEDDDDDEYDDDDDDDDEEEEDILLEGRSKSNTGETKFGTRNTDNHYQRASHESNQKVKMPASEEDARKLTVGELKVLLRERQIDFSGCLEKSEMLSLLMEYESTHHKNNMEKNSGGISTEGASKGMPTSANDPSPSIPENEQSGTQSTRARRAARKKAQQKRKKERQKAERSNAKSEEEHDTTGLHQASVEDKPNQTTPVSQSIANSTVPPFNDDKSSEQVPTTESYNESTLDQGGDEASQLRDEVLVDVANAVDAGDVRAARTALEAAKRVGLEPGGTYRALFEHAARLVKAADDRRDAESQRQRAKEEAVKRKQDDKRARREARKKALADKEKSQERERERREAERREKKLAKKKEKLDSSSTEIAQEDSDAANKANVSNQSSNSKATNPKTTTKNASTTNNKSNNKSNHSSGDKKNKQSSQPQSQSHEFEDKQDQVVATSSSASALEGTKTQDEVDLEQLEAEQLRQVLQMSLDEAARAEEDRKAAQRAAERAELNARRERERALQREWNSIQRRQAVQQSKAREAEVRREAELQRASQTAAAVALSGLPGFEDLARPSRSAFPPPTNTTGPPRPRSVLVRNPNIGVSSGPRQRGPAPVVTKQVHQQPVLPPPPVVTQSNSQIGANDPYDDDPVLQLAERSIAGVLDDDSGDDEYTSHHALTQNKAPYNSKPLGSPLEPSVAPFRSPSTQRQTTGVAAGPRGPTMPHSGGPRGGNLQAHAPPFGSSTQSRSFTAPVASRGLSPPTLPPSPGGQRFPVNSSSPLVHQLGGAPLFMPQSSGSPASPPGVAGPRLRGVAPHQPAGNASGVYPPRSYPPGYVPRPLHPPGYATAGGPPPPNQPPQPQRWLSNESGPRGPPRPPSQGSVGSPAPSLYGQRMASAPPFVPAAQRIQQQQQPGPRPTPSAVGPPGVARGMQSAFPAYAKPPPVVPLAPHGGLSPGGQQRATPPGAQRSPHLVGTPAFAPPGVRPRGTTPTGIQRPSSVYTTGPPPTQPSSENNTPRLVTSGVGGPINVPPQSVQAATPTAVQSLTAKIPAGSPRLQREAGPSEQPRWSAPQVDDSLRHIMEMSRQSELADALSTLDDSPARTSVNAQRPEVDARLAAAATGGVEWVPASVREARAKQSESIILEDAVLPSSLLSLDDPDPSAND